MNKRVLLQKLEQLQVASISDFKDQSEIVSWANKIAPVLERISLGLDKKCHESSHAVIDSEANLISRPIQLDFDFL